jgi:hypothetical protein
MFSMVNWWIHKHIIILMRNYIWKFIRKKTHWKTFLSVCVCVCFIVVWACIVHYRRKSGLSCLIRRDMIIFILHSEEMLKVLNLCPYGVLVNIEYIKTVSAVSIFIQILSKMEYNTKLLLGRWVHDRFVGVGYNIIC